MSPLTATEKAQVRRGQCPHCGSAVMVAGDPDTRLCVICLREYRLIGLGAEVLNDLCPPDRLRDVYGMPTTANAGDPFP